MRRDLPAGTLTLLFTHVEGSTRLLKELGEEGYARTLAEHRRKVREAFARHGGVEVDTQGDALSPPPPTGPGGALGGRRRAEAFALDHLGTYEREEGRAEEARGRAILRGGGVTGRTTGPGASFRCSFGGHRKGATGEAPLHDIQAVAAVREGRSRRRMTGRSAFRRATSVNPARSYMDLVPNHRRSGCTGPGRSTG